MLHGLITPHDQFQDGLLLLVILVSAINSIVLALHLRNHKIWRENEEGAGRYTGAIH